MNMQPLTSPMYYQSLTMGGKLSIANWKWAEIPGYHCVSV